VLTVFFIGKVILKGKSIGILLDDAFLPIRVASRAYALRQNRDITTTYNTDYQKNYVIINYITSVDLGLHVFYLDFHRCCGLCIVKIFGDACGVERFALLA